MEGAASPSPKPRSPALLHTPYYRPAQSKGQELFCQELHPSAMASSIHPGPPPTLSVAITALKMPPSHLALAAQVFH